MASDSTVRFTNRVGDYVRARPSYPDEVISVLRERIGLKEGWRVADIGSGTGISARLFLSAGCEVFGIEPNAAMRGAAETEFNSQPKFRSVDGIAEKTTLADRSIELIAAAQAFHWFDPILFRKECVRILKSGGVVLLMWNDRKLGGTPFLDGYEALLNEFSIDYRKVNHNNVSFKKIDQFFAPAACERAYLNNVQRFDYELLQARLLSSSYAPAADDPRSGPMLTALRRLFEETQNGGVVEMLYDVELHFGRLK